MLGTAAEACRGKRTESSTRVQMVQLADLQVGFWVAGSQLAHVAVQGGSGAWGGGYLAQDGQMGSM